MRRGFASDTSNIYHGGYSSLYQAVSAMRPLTPCLLNLIKIIILLTSESWQTVVVYLRGESTKRFLEAIF